MIIRRANIDDVYKIIYLVQEAYKMHYEVRKDVFKCKNKKEVSEELQFTFRNPLSVIFIAEENNIAVGYIIFRCMYNVTNSLWIDQFYIRKKYRNKGYGKSLINEVKEYAKNNNFERIELNCWTFNDNALDFYRYLGFKEQRIIFEMEV